MQIPFQLVDFLQQNIVHFLQYLFDMPFKIFVFLLSIALLIHINSAIAFDSSTDESFSKDYQQSNLQQDFNQNQNAAKVDYPVRFTYIDRINQWWPPQAICANIGVPGFAKQTIYNYIAFAFWGYGNGPMDIALIWSDPLRYFGGPTQFGSTNDQIQKNLKKKYNDKGIKVLISAFGATQFPTTGKVDPIACAQKLGDFVNKNNLDGVDIDWQDNNAMEAGTGQQWLIAFTKKLRELLPNHIITHAPQAPYFKSQYYKNGGYVTVHKQVGNLINFYNIQFYNQGDSKYDNYNELFLSASGFFGGTSVKQIIARGIPSNKIVVGKPVTPGDAANTGWMDSSSLGKSIMQGYNDMKWYGGVMFWQYVSDVNGVTIKNSVQSLVEACAVNKNCK